MPEVMPTPGSSNIASISYSEVEAFLDVEFLSGDTYRYSNVPATVWRGFQRAPSKGSYLHRVIKPAYSYEQI